jgi:gamma-glutamylaminecyclotransferase
VTRRAPPCTLFVYGSLLRGEINHERLSGASFLHEACTEPLFDLVDLGAYPGLVCGGRTAVRGEIYAVPAPLVAALDAFEDHPRTYRRSRIRLDDGRQVEAYLLPPALAAGLPRVRGGSWRDRVRAELAHGEHGG